MKNERIYSATVDELEVEVRADISLSLPCGDLDHTDVIYMNVEKAERLVAALQGAIMHLRRLQGTAGEINRKAHEDVQAKKLLRFFREQSVDLMKDGQSLEDMEIRCNVLTDDLELLVYGGGDARRRGSINIPFDVLGMKE